MPRKAIFPTGLWTLLIGLTLASPTCLAAPTMAIVHPDDTHAAQVGPFRNSRKFIARLTVASDSAGDQHSDSFSANDFRAQINSVDAPIVGGGYIENQYWLIIQAPRQVANGDYELSVSLFPTGSASVLATATNPASVVYGSRGVDHLLVMDRSGSMGADENLNGIPDHYENLHQIDSASEDVDLDDLDAASEYLFGTLPNNSDSDGGGENDGSELAKG